VSNICSQASPAAGRIVAEKFEEKAIDARNRSREDLDGIWLYGPKARGDATAESDVTPATHLRRSKP
jgi:hypothetical protein